MNERNMKAFLSSKLQNNSLTSLLLDRENRRTMGKQAEKNKLI